MGIIYLVKNIKNGMIYIGQTRRSLDARRLQHIRDSKKGSNTRFHRAIREYSTDSFEWNIIEDKIENDKLLSVEKEYIIKNNAYDENIGYNMKNFIEDGTKIDDDDLLEIISMLKTEEFTLKSIADAYGVSECHIGHINNGVTRRLPDFTYPLMNTNRQRLLTEEEVNEIKDLLQTSQTSQMEISKKFNISRKRVTSINNGDTYFDYETIYPIRKSISYTSDDKNIDIVNLLLNKEHQLYEIAEKIDVGYDVVWNINNGNNKSAIVCYEKTYNIKIDNFPILKTRTSISDEDIFHELYVLLTTTNMTYPEISKKIPELNKNTIVGFNNGTIKKYRNFLIKNYNIETFPIRLKK